MGLLKETLKVRALGLAKIPLIFFCRPSVIELNDEGCSVKIPFRRRNKNHLGSLYFGALAVGADLAGGLIAFKFMQESNHKIDLIFKDFKADFRKRIEGDCFFVCKDGAAIRELVKKAEETGERQEFPLTINAMVPSKLGDTPGAEFKLTLSLKSRGPKKKK